MDRLTNLQANLARTHLYDYVVVGGGISGLQAAEILTQSNKNILIIEAQHYLGGRISTLSVTDLTKSKEMNWVLDNQQLYKKVKIEKGATWIEERHYVLRQICKKYNIPLKVQYSQGNSTYLAERSYSNEQLLKNQQFGKEIRKFLNQIDRLAEEYDKVVLSASNKNSSEFKQMLSLYDSMTVQEYLKKTIQSKQVRDFVQNFLQHTECISADVNSMHEVLTKHARSNDVGILKEFLGIDQHQPSYLLEGTDVVIKKFIEVIENNIKSNIGSITKFNSQVIQVDNLKPEVTVVTCLSSKSHQTFKIYAKKVICGVPLQLIRNINFTNISQNKRIVFDNQLRTNALKTFVVFKSPFWRQLKNSGDGLFSYSWCVNMCHDISPEDDSCGILVFFHNGKKYYQWKRMFSFNQQEAYEEQKKYMGEVVSKMFNIEKDSKIYKQNFTEFFTGQSGFMENPHIRSGFQSNTRPGTFTQILSKGGDLSSLYNDQENIIFIGSQFSDSFASYIEGAIRITRKKMYNLVNKEDPLKSLMQSTNVVGVRNY